MRIINSGSISPDADQVKTVTRGINSVCTEYSTEYWQKDISYRMYIMEIEIGKQS